MYSSSADGRRLEEDPKVLIAHTLLATDCSALSYSSGPLPVPNFRYSSLASLVEYELELERRTD
jgi:hypothetical protein